MQSEVYEEIEQVASKMGKIEGVIGVILFGSYSRGDFHEGSDIDLLVIFRDKSALSRSQEEIYRITAEKDLFFQTTALTLKELKESTLLDSAIRDGKILHASPRLQKLLANKPKPHALITYSTSNLKAKGKVTFTHKLEGRRTGKYRYDGLLQENGGYKVGRGVLMIPLENLSKITRFLEGNKVEYVIRYVWIYP